MGMKIPVDFSDVPERGSVRIPEGDYVTEITKVVKKNAKSSGNPMLVVSLKTLSGPESARGKTLIDRHILVKDSLWTLRNLLEAIGYNVPNKPMKLDTDKQLMGRKVGISVIDGDEYKGRIRSEVADYMSPDVVGELTRAEDADITEEDEDELSVFMDDEDEDEDLDVDEEEEDEEDEEDEETEDEEESWEFSDEDEDETSDLPFSSTDEVAEAKGKQLKAWVEELIDAGYELDLPKKPKVADVRSALIDLFNDETEDEEEMEEFSLDEL